MIPLKLTLSNFLCYRDNVPPLDFTGLHVACICGSNGHGKSALLDSITWALWGKARGRVQDEMISYGADECRVELDFTSRDQNYRVIRSHARGGIRRRSGASDLQLMVLENEIPRAITGDLIRETQARIDQTIGMDYDTFINSAFLGPCRRIHQQNPRGTQSRPQQDTWSGDLRPAPAARQGAEQLGREHRQDRRR